MAKEGKTERRFNLAGDDFVCARTRRAGNVYLNDGVKISELLFNQYFVGAV